MNADCSVAGLGTHALTGDQLDEIFDRNEPLASRWKPIRVKVLDDEPREAGDFPPFYDYPGCRCSASGPGTCSAHRSLAAGRRCRSSIRARKPFYLIHVMEVIDCVDHARSEIEYYDDGRVASIERYCLKPELLVGKHIFRTPMASGSYLLVDDVFRQVVESHKLKGLEFHAIPRVDAPG